MYAIGWNHFGLDAVGAWPRRNVGLIGRERSTLCAIAIFTLMYLPQSASIIVHWGNMDAVIATMTVVGPVFVAIVKLLLFRLRRKEIRVFIDFMNEDWEAPRSSEERQVMQESAEVSRFMSIVSGALTNMLLIAYAAYKTYFGLQMKQNMSIDERLGPGLLYPAWPLFGAKQLTSFIIMWISQFISAFFSMTIYAVFDCMISAMVLHICGQFKVLGITLRNLINETIVSDISFMKSRLSSIVQRHEKLIELINVIEHSFSGILLAQLLICTLTFCFQGYAIINSFLDPAAGKISFLEIVFSFVYVFYTVLHLYYYCHIGDRLLVESSAVGYDFYCSKWYNLPGVEARVLLFVGYRTSTPLTITAGSFCNFSKNLFIAIMKTSMGYLSMLMTVKQRLAE